MKRDMATLTKTQMQILSKYESNMENAVKSDWCRAMGRADLEKIHKVYVDATGSNIRLNVNCATCTLSLLKDVGNLYFAQKKEKPVKVGSRQVKKV